MLHVPVSVASQQENMACWFYYDATKPGVIENRICEGTVFLKAALCIGMTSLQVLVVSARSVSRRSSEAVTLLCLVSSLSILTYRVKYKS